MRKLSPVITDIDVLKIVINHWDITRTQLSERLKVTKSEIKKFEKILIKNGHLAVIPNLSDTRRIVYEATIEGCVYYEKERVGIY